MYDGALIGIITMVGYIVACLVVRAVYLRGSA